MKIKKYFAVKNKESDERIVSSSGGVFLTLAKNILSKKGVVYGAIYDESFNVIHVRSENIDDVMKMTGSKYSQSDLKNVINEVIRDLEDDKYVLFSGTPCQVNSINMCTKNNNSKLITVDLICHGTPEKFFLRDYVDILEKKNKSKVKSINMRYKDKKEFNKNLNRKHIPIGNVEPKYMRIDFINGKKIIERADFNSYYLMFDYFIKPGCFKCPFANLERRSDITLGDFHEFNTKLGDFNDGNGISLIIINTEKGEKLIEEVKDKYDIVQKKEEECLQPALKSAATRPTKYETFRNDYKNNGYEYVAKKYVQSGVKYHIKKLLYKTKILDFLLKIKNK